MCGGKTYLFTTSLKNLVPHIFGVWEGQGILLSNFNARQHRTTQNQQKHQSTRLLFAAFCTAFTQFFSHSPCFWSGGLGKCSPPPQGMGGMGGVATALRSSLCLSARACDTLWPRAMLTTSCIKASLKQFRVLLTYLPRIESQIEHNWA